MTETCFLQAKHHGIYRDDGGGMVTNRTKHRQVKQQQQQQQTTNMLTNGEVGEESQALQGECVPLLDMKMVWDDM
eukprot:1898176-Ditylum_brightwellii.AAC.1